MWEASTAIKITPPRALAGGFLLIICLGTMLLFMPAASASGHSMGFMDALFTAMSATCVTGLIIVDTGTHFSLFGQIVLLTLVQFGGVGFMTMATWISLMMRRKISLQERLILTESMNEGKMEGIITLTRKVFLYSIAIEAVAAIYFAIHWSRELSFSKALYFGIFHAVSIFNNAGFELLGGFRSLTPYVDDVGMNIVSILLIFTGGVGFIVISDLIEYPKVKKLSLHSKVVLAGSAILTVIGAIVIFAFEYTNTKTLGPLSWDTKLLASVFQSVTLRSAGVNTIDIGGLRESTQLFMILMMFIGAAPGSTGGGIKVTTFIVLFAAVGAMLRGKEDVVLFRQRISKGDLYRAISVSLLAVFLLITATLLLCVFQDQNFLMILFEAASAFGTVGLSMGLTPDLTAAGKVIIVVMMFIGRIGLVTLAYALLTKRGKELYRHPEGKIIIG